ncbi:MAG: hypothetical protein DWQ21_07265 [Bacteroidetes bacterium]|nr:MAG: hypothetical protein DWQ21_07265 [Bacteroidota bacterium]REK64304.1 MAG: hypothetical protein DWQ49_01800 [Bacteroidota bacterium]
MNFSIKTLRGQNKTLGIQDLLGILGDDINDEIVIGDNTYRISTAQPISSGASPVDWVITPLTVQASGQERFQLPQAILDPESAFFTVNNVDYTHGVHYHFDGTELVWHQAFALEPSDEVHIKYPITV